MNEVFSNRGHPVKYDYEGAIAVINDIYQEEGFDSVMRVEEFEGLGRVWINDIPKTPFLDDYELMTYLHAFMEDLTEYLSSKITLMEMLDGRKSD